MKYDYLIVGSGLFGSTFAQQAKENKKKVLIIDKRSHIGGNIYTENIDGINVHKYGCHIFHTNKQEVWDYVNRFVSFNNYRHKGVVNFKDKIFSFPINLMTLCQVYGVTNPNDAQKMMNQDKVLIHHPKNMEEWCLANIGKKLYKIFIEGYSKKQWGCHPKKLPSTIIKRLPVRLTFDDNYFHDFKFQGIPIGGYTKLIKNMIDGIKVELGTDYSEIKDWKKYAKNLVFSGGIDQFFNYEYGELEYRSLKWEHEKLQGDFQGTSCVNYTDLKTKFTRIVEHKHFENSNLPNTIISKEYSTTWKETKDPYYPITNEKNLNLYNKYKKLTTQQKNVIISGRLGSYKYLDMDDTISLSLKTYDKIN
jgi:UDP-galactopyranose mutase